VPHVLVDACEVVRLDDQAGLFEHLAHELARRRDQAKAEQVGERRRCPICRLTQQPGRPRYRGLRLDGPLAEFQRAVDRLRWDTVPAPLDQPASSPAAPRRGRRQVDGQADLLDSQDRERSA
jgi:hypothetical protein